MTVDEIVKLMIFGSLSISVLGISVQLMRILGGFADMLGDLRATVKNLGTLSTQLVEDYKLIGSALRGIAGGLSSFNDKVIQPLTRVGNMFGGFWGKDKS